MERELNLGVMHLGHERTATLTGCNYLATDYLNGVCSGPVSGPHVPVALSDCCPHTQVSVLSVHVVGSRSRVIPEPDPKVFDDQWLLLPDFLHGHNLTGGLLEFPKLPQEVPESGLGHDLVRGELAANNAIFLQSSLRLHRDFSPM